MSTATPLRLDTAACDRCGRCVPLCKPNALRVGPGYIFVDWEKCTTCRACVDACDRGAITVRSAPAGSKLPARPVAPAPEKRPWLSWPARAGKHAAPPLDATQPVAPAVTPYAAPEAPTSAWTLPEAALVLVVAFALLLGAQALPGGLASAPVWAGVTLVVYDTALAVLLWFLAHRRSLSLPAAFRLDVAPELANAALALGVAFGCWLFSVVYRAVALGFGARPPVADGVDLGRMFGSGVAGTVLTFAVIAIAGPLLEELLLRGVVLGAVSAKVGKWPAIVGCALAFALLHASLWSLLPLTVLGIGLGWLAVRSRSLWPAVVAHVLYNAVLVAAAFYAMAG